MKRLTLALLSICTLGLIATRSHADTSITAYGTYWDAKDVGKGGGLRLKKTFLGFGAVEGRGGYVEFTDTNTEVIPLDVALNVRLPFMISPYIGAGVGYYLIDSDIPKSDNRSGHFFQFGVEATIKIVGVMAEIRWHELEEGYFDGTSVNAGILIKW